MIVLENGLSVEETRQLYIRNSELSPLESLEGSSNEAVNRSGNAHVDNRSRTLLVPSAGIS